MGLGCGRALSGCRRSAGGLRPAAAAARREAGSRRHGRPVGLDVRVRHLVDQRHAQLPRGGAQPRVRERRRGRASPQPARRRPSGRPRHLARDHCGLHVLASDATVSEAIRGLRLDLGRPSLLSDRLLERPGSVRGDRLPARIRPGGARRHDRADGRGCLDGRARADVVFHVRPRRLGRPPRRPGGGVRRRPSTDAAGSHGSGGRALACDRGLLRIPGRCAHAHRLDPERRAEGRPRGRSARRDPDRPRSARGARPRHGRGAAAARCRAAAAPSPRRSGGVPDRRDTGAGVCPLRLSGDDCETRVALVHRGRRWERPESQRPPLPPVRHRADRPLASGRPGRSQRIPGSDPARGRSASTGSSSGRRR